MTTLTLALAEAQASAFLAEAVAATATPVATTPPAAVVAPAAALTPPTPQMVAKPLVKASPVPNVTAKDIAPDILLLKILETKRAHGSVGDNNFRLWLFAEITNMGYKPCIAKEGTIIVEVGKKSTTLFSCHIDTCHGNAESDGTKQHLLFDAAFGHIFLPKDSKSGCLGADDGIGIYLMLKMMKAKVKGYYAFHTGEERGGIGSRAVLATQAKWLENFDRCVAFDRAVRHGTSPEVIITQGGRACASLEFGKQLAEALNEHEFDEKWVISHNGTFTDSKTYAGIIPECVNVGCFYVNQHTPNETVEVWGVEQLLTACLKIKWETLKAVRKPVEAYTPRTTYQGGDYGSRQAQKDFYSDGYGGDGFDDFKAPKGGLLGYQKPKSVTKPSYTPPPAVNTVRSTFDDMLTYTKDEIAELIDTDPEIAADMICLFVARYKGLKSQVSVLEEYLGG